MMFVTRWHLESVERAHEATIHFWEGRARELAAALADERALTRYLLAKYHALKLSGAAEAEPVVMPEKKEPDPAMQAINALSAGRPGLRAHMLKQLLSDRANPLLDETGILARIQDGMPAFEEGVPG